MIMLPASEYAEKMITGQGASAFFSVPEHALDPALFTADDRLHPVVRSEILGRLQEFLNGQGIRGGDWLRAWLAGSGVSYQWRASRGNGDLDVLLGADPARFLALNPGLAAGSRTDLAALLNERLKARLWPVTAATAFGGTVYEITYYWNPQVSDDITVIRPYAAWNLITSGWDVKPDPEPSVTFPRDWHERAGQDAASVQALYREWSQALADVLLLPQASPSRVTAEAGLRRVTGQIRATWDVIHDGRRNAFTGDGKGWGDWANFRWQAAKGNGTIALLREVIAGDDARRAEQDTRLYGAPVTPGDLALRRAATAHGRWSR